MHLRTVPFLFAIVLLAVSLSFGQAASPSPTSGANPDPATSPAMSADLNAYGQMLGQLQQVAQQTAGDLGRLRIDKWKADSSVKQQSQSNTASLQRNLTAALPEIIQKAQAAPQDMAPNLKLYRNLNVLYDVLSVMAENAGAFGPKEQYEPLANDVAQLDQLRRSFADRMDWLAGVKDNQLKQLTQQLAAAQQQAKAVADQKKSETTTPAKKSSAKKKKKAPTE